MPTISVEYDYLKNNLKFPLSDDFEKVLFDFGLELDAIDEEELENGEISQIYKIEIPANRCDLLAPESLCLMLNIYMNCDKIPSYKIDSTPSVTMNVDDCVNVIRPYVVCALLKDVDLSGKGVYEHMIELQSKLHQNIGRNRSLISMGTHDFDKLQPPFLYTTQPPEKIKFVPLNFDKEMTAVEMMKEVENSHLKPYLPLLKDAEEYPVIYDSNGVVLSVPPIINGEHSKVTRETKNVFIEMTAKDYHRAAIALETFVAAFSVYSKEKYHCGEVVHIQYSNKKDFTPKMAAMEMDASVDNLNSIINLEESAESISSYLELMGLKSVVCENGKTLKVTIPPTRHDIIHWYDIAEDYAISYGYNNIKRRFPRTNCVAWKAPINALSEKVRPEMAMMGYIEVSNFALCSIEEVEEKLGWTIENSVRLENPKTSDFQIVRNFLFPGLLKSLRSNKMVPLPISIFEVGDIVVKDVTMEVGAKNYRHVSALHCKRVSAFEHIHGSLDRLFNTLGKYHVSYPGGNYELVPLGKGSHGKLFLPGRGAHVVYDGKVIGFVGELIPTILKEFDIPWPCSIFEIDISLFK